MDRGINQAIKMVEALLLALTAIGMLFLLLPLSIGGGILISLMLAVALIAVLVLRSLGWHNDNATPYDIIIVAGAAILLLYLASFMALSRGVLNAIIVWLFIIYFVILSILMLLHAHEVTPAMQRAPKVKLYSHVDHAQDKTFMRGVQPIIEHEPPRSWFARKLTKRRHTQAIKRASTVVPATRLHKEHLTQERTEHIRQHLWMHGIEPIHELEPPHAGKMHDAKFKRGIEPIKPVLRVYGRKKKAKR